MVDSSGQSSKRVSCSFAETADFANSPHDLRFSSRFEQVDSIGFNQTSQLGFPTAKKGRFRRRHTLISEGQSVA
ncbi:hypothetical protein K0M31_012506 [Melipona bicolor]|uniref:Uncharacterized protein n=1 Tax=Melipona bicolor TaxID=60889 RepID=A0AA40FKE4_9HYME|nr:hypothetical protein K0M31_012506 [Melipona bicolor]